MSTEYLSKNTLQVYPFKDHCSLKSVEGYALDKGFIADCQFLDYNGTAAQIYLKSILLGELNNVLTWTVIKTDNTTQDLTFTAAWDLAPFTLATYGTSGQGIAIRLVVGEKWAENHENLEGNYTFSLATAEINASCIVPASLYVKSVTFQNYEDGEIVPDVTITDEVSLRQGFNVNFQGTTDLEMSVYAGAGRGLYSNCPPPGEEQITQINGIGATELGNFQFLTDTCYGYDEGVWVNGVLTDPAGLSLTHRCTPGCTAEKLAALAHYENRVKDALLKVGAYANLVNQGLKETIEAYQLKRKINSYRYVPYLTAEQATVQGSTKSYITTAVAINDPRHGTFTSDLIVTASNQLSLISGTSLLNTGEILQRLPDVMGYSQKNIDCKSTAIYEMSAEMPKDQVNQSITWKLVYPTGRAYYLMPIAMDHVYFIARYTNFKENGQYGVSVIVELKDDKNRNPLSTTLSIGLPSGLVVDPSTIFLIKNGVAESLPAPGFSNKSLNYENVNKLTFVALKTGTGSGNIVITVTVPGETQTNSLPIDFF